MRALDFGDGVYHGMECKDCDVTAESFEWKARNHFGISDNDMDYFVSWVNSRRKDAVLEAFQRLNFMDEPEGNTRAKEYLTDWHRMRQATVINKMFPPAHDA